MTDQLTLKIIAVLAHDWGTYAGQMSRETEFTIVTGWVIGELLSENEVFITIAHHAFLDGDVRHVTCVPVANIIRRHEFEVTL